MTGRLVDISFSLNRKQRITLEVDSDFRNLWDKLNQEPLLDIEIKKHRNKRSRSANAYFHVLVNKIAAETGESDDLVKERLVVAYGTVARDKDGCTVGFKLPVSVDVHDLYKWSARSSLNAARISFARSSSTRIEALASPISPF